MIESGYTLVVGEKNYSSWSMRVWLALFWLGLPFEMIEVQLYRPNTRLTVEGLGGETGLVPVLRHGGLAIWDTMAILEYLAERHVGLWPELIEDRVRARSYCGELHSGFHALRRAMPVNTRGRNRIAAQSVEVADDLARIQTIWDRAKSPWLFGKFGAADIMFAPVATRLRTYGVSLSGPAEDYHQRLLEHPLIQKWCALGQAETTTIPILELPQRPLA